MSGKYENAMLRQVLSVPELLEQVYPDVEPQVRYVLTTPQIFSVKKVVLTSCGDGYAACLAAMREEPYSRAFQGIWAEPDGAYSTTVSETVCLD